MKLTNGKIVQGQRLSISPKRYEFTVQVEGDAEITIGESVNTFSLPGFDDLRLKELIAYLEDRPSLMSENEVMEGVHALKYLFPK